MSLFEPKSLDRIAAALEGLLALYTMDLEDRGLRLTLPPKEEEGEVLTTDDDRVAELLERLLRNRPYDDHSRGVFLDSDAEGIGTPPPQEGAEVQVGPDFTAFGRFGGSWGFNVGPEGAEENWRGTDGNGSTGIPAAGDVRRQGDSEKQEGQSRPDSGA